VTEAMKGLLSAVSMGFDVFCVEYQGIADNRIREVRLFLTGVELKRFREFIETIDNAQEDSRNENH
jgi:hypothetical protein